MSRGSFVLACVLLVACNKAGGDGATGQGKERGACYGNGTCDDGLQCMSEVCVRPPPADCAPVAEKLASYRLGNYAPRDERAKVVGELTAQCQAAKLTVDEGACIVKAQSRYDVAKCPRPLLEELVADGDGCQVAAATVTRVLLQELGQGGDPARVEALRPKLEAALADSCVSDLWPEEAKRCITGATSSRDMSRCEKVFPRDLGDRIGQRIKPLLEELTRAMM
ncbi:MAG: hypothetical protein KC464_03640, partial [Myxococcales bacterium]|nr:hypothetical protein [Myxococcales bacterium]